MRVGKCGSHGGAQEHEPYGFSDTPPVRVLHSFLRLVSPVNELLVHLPIRLHNNQKKANPCHAIASGQGTIGA
jgi:hypothetical protein